MKILMDECLPSELSGTLTEMGHECQTVRQAGFGSKKNGELLTIAEGRWEVLLPSDRNIKYQQNMTGRSISIVIFARQVQSYEGSPATDARVQPGASGDSTRPSARSRPTLGQRSRGNTTLAPLNHRARYYDPSAGRFLSETSDGLKEEVPKHVYAGMYQS